MTDRRPALRIRPGLARITGSVVSGVLLLEYGTSPLTVFAASATLGPLLPGRVCYRGQG